MHKILHFTRKWHNDLFTVLENDVVSNIFVDEESFDDSDSESGDDIYGYLGAVAMPCSKLLEESCILTVLVNINFTKH